jgi:hypothetical protein
VENGSALCARGTTIEIKEAVRSGDPERLTSTEQPKRWTFATGSSHRSSSRRRRGIREARNTGLGSVTMRNRSDAGMARALVFNASVLRLAPRV